MNNPVNAAKLKTLLTRHWSFSDLKAEQSQLVQAVINGYDCVANLPTGFGKSICFQLAALYQEGLCLVISPLISLMYDQVESLKSKSIKAYCIHSGIPKWKQNQILDNCIYGDIKLLYLSPEGLNSALIKERLKKMNISFIAVDEAHCISQWGHDFRPSYRKIASLREYHKVPIMALTATGTKVVLEDIVKNLVLDHPFQIIKSPRRDNLGYLALETEKKIEFLSKEIRQSNESNIVYLRSRRGVMETSMQLNHQGLSTLPFHGGMPSKQKLKNQEAWLKDEVKTIVATNAFGMGIDKSNVRKVLHLDIPPSLEDYIQEAGRGGRDGSNAMGIIYYTKKDIESSKNKIEKYFPSIEEVRLVYKNLCIGIDLAVGSMMDFFMPIHFYELSKKLNISIPTVLSACRLLQQSGLLEYSEQLYQPSRVYLFKDQVSEYQRVNASNEKLNSLIRNIARKYEGVFFDYQTITEDELQKASNLSKQELTEFLNQIITLGLGDYLPSHDKPSFRIGYPRLSSNSIQLDPQFYEQRKHLLLSKLNSMISYLETDECRQVFIDEYFGTPNISSCGICDNCSNKNTSRKISTNTLITAIPFDGIGISSLTHELSSYKAEIIKELVAQLIDENIFTFKDNKIFRSKH